MTCWAEATHAERTFTRWARRGNLRAEGVLSHGANEPSDRMAQGGGSNDSPPAVCKPIGNHPTFPPESCFLSRVPQEARRMPLRGVVRSLDNPARSRDRSGVTCRYRDFNHCSDVLLAR